MPTKDEQPQAPASTDSVGRLVLRAYRQMLDYLFLSTSSIVGLLIVLIFFPGVFLFYFIKIRRPISIFLLVVMAVR